VSSFEGAFEAQGVGDYQGEGMVPAVLGRLVRLSASRRHADDPNLEAPLRSSPASSWAASWRIADQLVGSL
jgi:hypothetical protein